jgi:hypothetical protein
VRSGAAVNPRPRRQPATKPKSPASHAVRRLHSSDREPPRAGYLPLLLLGAERLVEEVESGIDLRLVPRAISSIFEFLAIDSRVMCGTVWYTKPPAGPCSVSFSTQSPGRSASMGADPTLALPVNGEGSSVPAGITPLTGESRGVNTPVPTRTRGVQHQIAWLGGHQDPQLPGILTCLDLLGLVSQILIAVLHISPVDARLEAVIPCPLAAPGTPPAGHLYPFHSQLQVAAIE